MTRYATIMEVHEDGLTIKVDGEEQSRQKRYPCSSTTVFEAEQRVKLSDDGTVPFIESAVGAPLVKISLPSLSTNSDLGDVINWVNNFVEMVDYRGYKWFH